MRIAFTTFGSHLQVGFWRNVFASLNHPLTPTESYEEGQVAPQCLSACREAAQFNQIAAGDAFEPCQFVRERLVSRSLGGPT